MSHKRFWWSVVAVWAVMFLTDWWLHGMWLQPWYQQTAQYWRSADDIQQMMPWMWAGQLIFAWAFVWIYSKGISKDNQWVQAFRYALAILLVAKVPGNLMMWATTPYPVELIWRWFLIGTIQALAASYIMTWTWAWAGNWKKARA